MFQLFSTYIVILSNNRDFSWLFFFFFLVVCLVSLCSFYSIEMKAITSSLLRIYTME